VTVEVALEVEVSELLTFRDLEEFLKGGIGLDVVLILEALFFDVVVDLLGDIGAGDEGASRVAEELAEFISNLGGDLEDGRTTLHGLFTIFGDTAFALAGILDFTVDTLIKALDLSDHRRHGLAESGEGSENGFEVLIKSGGRGSRRIRRDRGGSGRSRGGNRNRRRSGGRGGGSSSGFLGDTLGRSLSGSSNRGRSRGGYRGRSSSIFSLLGDTFTLGGSSSGVHHTSTGGRIHLN
jgi:hypothetical protein